ncbi:MAG TPA: putative lipid II flippase FtsW [Thermoanaerobaculia bacterium]|nr:putative lipid II flippase FtsW [Thermoanaerobaculia bacterium]
MARKLKFDKVLLAVVVLLLLFGLVMVYSASAVARPGDVAKESWQQPLVKQSIAASIGLVLMVGAMTVDYQRLKEPWALYGLVLLSLVLLVAVLFAPLLNNTRRWLFLGGFSFQPSELAKVAVVAFLAYQLDRKSDRVGEPVFLVPSTLLVLLVCALILIEPDFGTGGLVLAVAAFLLFVGGVGWRYLGAGALLLLPVITMVVVLVPYRRARLFAYLRPEDDPLDKGFQILQSLIAVGSGGVFGLGLGQSVQKLHFLPMANSDFIFAIVCEELGLIGALTVVGLFAVLAWRGLRAGSRAPDAFGRYLAWGLTAVIVLQALVNISITLNLLPTKGAALPLVSYGGSSLMMTLLACGLILNVSQHA